MEWKYCLSKYYHDKSFNSQFVENKYFDELNRQLDIMHSIYDELVSILNCSSKDIFNLREREDYDYQYNCFISAIEQEKMRARIWSWLYKVYIYKSSQTYRSYEITIDKDGKVSKIHFQNLVFND